MHYHFGYPFNPARADLPTAPQNLRVTASDDTNITLEWDASTQGDFPISNYKLIADDLVIATPVGTSFIWDAVPANESVSYRVQAVDSDGNAGPWSDTLTYTNVVATDDAPIYLMTEPLVNDGSFDYLFNSATSGTKWDGKLLTSTDTAWNPDSAQYPEDGTIDFSGGNKADTQWEAPQDTEWTMSGIYNVVMGVSYDMYSIHYKGNQTCDIYLGSNTEDLALSESDKDYTPPTGNWIIEEEPPSIIIPEDVLGVERVTNPNFDANVDGWSTSGTLTLDWEAGGYGKATSVDQYANYDFFSQVVECDETKTQRITTVINDLVPSTVTIELYQQTAGGTLVSYDTTGTHTIDVDLPASGNFRIYVKNNSVSANGYLLIDSFSIKDIL